MRRHSHLFNFLYNNVIPILCVRLSCCRYYYAVVVCDSSATANHLYMNLDGTELLKTSNVFDLQFIPDSMEFKHPARDVATEVSYFTTLYHQQFWYIIRLKHETLK